VHHRSYIGGGDEMRWMMIAVVLANVVFTPAAIAQHRESDVSTAPSAQNSGAGIADQPGSKGGLPPSPER
jgi:hypothetical protein